MKNSSFIIILLLTVKVFGQTNFLDIQGFKRISILYNNDSINILIKSKSGDEMKSKPLFFFCQGSLPIPLLIKEGKEYFPQFPFNTNAICEKYHLVLVGKPGIPFIIDSKDLQSDYSYFESNSQKPPIKYSKNNYLEYYVKRNLYIIDYLTHQKYVNVCNLIVAGHSQGARVAIEMALKSKRITHLIYACGNPCGQIMSMVSKSRQRENLADSTKYADDEFQYYEEVVENIDNIDGKYYDLYKSTYSFSKSSISSFSKLKIPVLVCYGTMDPSTPFNDYLHTEIIRKRKNNFRFQAYIGLDHNFFGVNKTGEIDFENNNWDNIANDWLKWLNLNLE